MKLPELKGQTLNVLIPTVIWTLSVVNMVIAAWTLSGVAFYLVVATLVAVSVGSAWAFDRATTLLRDQATVPVRLLLYASLFGGVSAASWDLVPPWPWWKAEEEPAPPLNPPPAPIGRAAEPLSLPGPARLEHVPANVIALIAQAQSRLASERLDIESCGGTWGDDGKPNQAQCLCDYKLAVTDPTGTISVVEAYEGKPSNPPGYDVANGSTGRACGTNPDLSVTHPPGQTVLAVRTVVKTGGRKGYDVEPAVFTPFTDELDIPELREAGLAYWWDKVGQAKSELARKQVRSQFFTDRLVTDAIPADHVFLLGIVENVGVLSYFYDQDKEAEQLREIRAVLVLFGANRENTFDWRVSSARARGPVQVIPSTYAGLVANYPKARLVTDHETGTADHLNAAQMAFLHGDEEWRYLEGGHRDFLLRNNYPMRWYMAAGYNCNAGKIAGIIRSSGAAWMSSRALAPCNNGETYGYLRKYKAADAAFFDPIENERLRMTLAPAE